MTVDRSRVGAIAVITINRPEKRNALDPATIEALGDALIEAEEDPAVRVVILTGAGDRAFCAGMDLTGVGAKKRGPTAGSSRYQAFLSSPYPKPIIGAANATAVAGGFELLLACDMVISADHAMFALPEVKRGLVAGAGGTLLPLRIPLPIAIELALTGDPIDAHRARELGLVNRVVPAGEVLDEALRLAESIAANSPNAVRITKQLLYDTREMPAELCWDRIREVIPSVMASADAHEGSKAFLERRTPRWTDDPDASAT